MKTLRKKAIAILLSLAVVMAYMPCTAFAESTDDGNWYDQFAYYLDSSDKTITLTGYNGNGGDVTVPALTVIDDEEYSTVITGPIFKGTKVTSVTFEDGCSTIGSLKGLFQSAYYLEHADLSGLDTTGILNMGSMFKSCFALKSVNFTGIDTSLVTDMSYMFADCYDLTELDVSGFNTGRVTTMSSMFDNCRSLEYIDVSGFDMSRITKSNNMFYNCESLGRIEFNNMNMPRNKNMQAMFAGCKSAVSIEIIGADTSAATNMGYLFYGCESAETIVFTGLDTHNVTDMQSMFSGCSSVKSLDLSQLNTSNVVNMSSMFSGLECITSLDLSTFDTSNVQDMGYMFSDCKGLTSIDLSSFTFSNGIDMGSMFMDSSNIESISFPSGVEFETTHHEGAAATCTEYGWDEYDEIEEIGYSTKEYIEPLGHTPLEPVFENETPSTCSEHGYAESVIYCSKCHDVISRDVVELPLAEHKPGSEVTENRKESTCSKEGSYDKVTYCTECGSEVSRDTVSLPLKDHNPGSEQAEGYVDATCTEDGEYFNVIRCTECDEILSSTKVVIEAVGHSEAPAVNENVINPTCEESGSYDSVVYCYDCGEEVSRVNVVTQPLGHKFSAGRCIRCNKKRNEVRQVSSTEEYAAPVLVASMPKLASAQLTDYNDVSVTWEADDNDSYDVYYKQASEDTWKVRKVKSDKTSFTGLDSGKRYEFKVRAKKGISKSGFTKTITVTTLKKMSAPSVSKNGKYAKVAFKASAGASGYQISKSTKKTGTNIAWTGKILKKNLSAKKGKKYYYKVRAYKTVKGKKVYGPWSGVKAYTVK